jgi:hypothetical protein
MDLGTEEALLPPSFAFSFVEEDNLLDPLHPSPQLCDLHSEFEWTEPVWAALYLLEQPLWLHMLVAQQAAAALPVVVVPHPLDVPSLLEDGWAELASHSFLFKLGSSYEETLI